MNTQSDDDEYFVPDFDLGAFRHLAARYVKLLIRARWSCEPGFLPLDELASWHLKEINKDSQPAWYSLGLAAETLGELNRDFLPRCGSGGVRLTNESTPIGRLIGALSFLAIWWGGGPNHNSTLVKASQDLRGEQRLDWMNLVNWAMLPGIRADLDQLPNSVGAIDDLLHLEGKVKTNRLKPKWSARIEGQWVGILSVGEAIARRVTTKATKVIAILDAFEAVEWKTSIPCSAFKGTPDRVNQDINCANTNLEIIVFYSDGQGNGISWKYR